MNHFTSPLHVFALIARYGSFTRAAAELDVSASALSQKMRLLERELGVRLLQRSTRHVGLTEAGQELLARTSPALNAIDDALDNARQYGDRPAGTLRITVPPIAPIMQVMPEFLAAWPEVTLDITVDARLVDLIDGGFDAGIRLGRSLDKDMVALPLGGFERALVVGSPEYFARHGRPRHPRELQAHSCVRFRFMTSGAIYRWEFYDHSAKQWFEVNVGGNLIVNDNRLMLAAARAGVALSRVRASIAAADISAGHLETVLNKWLPPTDGWYLYYPSRFQVPPKLRVFIDFMRERLSDLSGEHL